MYVLMEASCALAGTKVSETDRANGHKQIEAAF